MRKGQRHRDYTGLVKELWTVETFIGWRGARQLYICRDIFGAREVISSKSFCKKIFGTKLHSKDSIRKRKILLNAYNHMMNRCYNSKDKSYNDYGGRGIQVCDAWLGIKGPINFLIWAITIAKWNEGLWLDRIDNEQGYYPENCRFVTSVESGRNRRMVKLTKEKADIIRSSFEKSTLTRSEFCRQKAIEFNVYKSTIDKLLYNIIWN